MKLMKNTESDALNVLTAAYGISHIKRISEIANGDWNVIYKIEADGQWILRFSHHRKRREQLEFELKLIDDLSQELTVVPRVGRTTDDRLYYGSGGAFCSLFQMLPGEDIAESDNELRSAGTTLARLHNHLELLSASRTLIDNMSLIGFDWAANYFYSGDMFNLDFSDPVVCGLREAIPFLRELRIELSKWIKDPETDRRLTRSVIHGDYYQRNILWDGRRISGVIDWDETHTSYLEYELANALWEFSLQNETMTMDGKAFDQILNSYAKIRSTPADEKTLRYLIGVRRLIEIQMDLFEYRNGGSYDIEYCAQNVEGLKNLRLDEA